MCIKSSWQVSLAGMQRPNKDSAGLIRAQRATLSQIWYPTYELCPLSPVQSQEHSYCRLCIIPAEWDIRGRTQAIRKLVRALLNRIIEAEVHGGAFTAFSRCIHGAFRVLSRCGV
jgi:hypothetical protein